MNREHTGRLQQAAGMALLVAAAVVLVSGTGCRRGQKTREAEIPMGSAPTAKAWSPSWYESAGEAEGARLRETAQALGATPAMSELMAVNQARQAIALAIEVRVDVLQRSFQEQVDTIGTPELLRRFQNVNTVVSSRMLRGSSVVKKETYHEGDAYRTFVLMEASETSVDEAYLDELRSIDLLETRLRSGEAWAELERKALELRRERDGGGGE